MKESFNIPIVEGWKTVDAGKTKIRLKGVALKGDVVSKNHREYVASELAKSTNTFIGKPVTVNHNNDRKVGHITWMDWSDGLLTYEAEINREPYVSLLRNKSTDIRGVSIQADYLFNKCTRCGKKFYTEEDFQNHMLKEEYIRNVSAVPHGIIGQALSLVLSPEVPGYDGTTVELAEMMRREVLRLSETITKEYLEKEDYMTKIKEAGVSIQQKSSVVAGIQGVSVATFGSDTSDGSVPVQVVVETEPKVAEQEEEKPAAQCDDGYHWDEGQEACVPDEKAEPEKPTEEAVKQPEMKPTEECSCPVGTHWDGSDCVPNTSEITIRESKIGRAAWTDIALPSFDAVLKETKDEIKAAQILKEKREMNEAFKNVVYTLNEIITEVNKPIVVKSDDKSWVQEVAALRKSINGLAEQVAKIPEDDKAWLKLTKDNADRIVKETSHLQFNVDKGLASIKEYVATSMEGPHNNFLALAKKVEEIKSYDDKELREKVESIKPYDDKELREALKEIPQLKETIAKQKQDFDALLASADKSVKEYFESNKKELEEKTAEIEKLNAKIAETDKKKLEETENLTTRVENLEDKLKPNFKGKSNGAIEKEPERYATDPLKKRGD